MPLLIYAITVFGVDGFGEFNAQRSQNGTLIDDVN